MANYCNAIRTNYFAVKDENAFLAFMDSVMGMEENVEVWQKKFDDGITRFGFGCIGGIFGYVDPAFEEDDAEYDVAYDAFIKGLQAHVTDNDAVIILETGRENLRYIIGLATVITKSRIRSIDLENVALRAVREMLDNPEYDTVTSY